MKKFTLFNNKVLLPILTITLFTALMLVHGMAVGQTHTKKYTTVGTHTYTVPEGVIEITVHMWGGGGAGGGTSHPNAGGGGGAGGSYNIVQNLPVTPSETILITVGAGGTGNSGTDGNPGEASKIVYNETTYIANGGNAGGGGEGNTGYLGGIKNTGNTFNGGAGANGTAKAGSASPRGGAGGGSAGSNSDGGDGINITGGAGGTGTYPGGVGAAGIGGVGNGNSATAMGGGGGGSAGAGSTGGNGAAGQVVITYTAHVEDNVSISSSLEVDDLEISSGSSLTITGSGSLHVRGNLTNNAGASGLIIQNGGSLIHNAAGVQATVQYSAPGGGDWKKGDKTNSTAWNWLSSPVTSLNNIASFVGGLSKYDLYRWDESADVWRNHKGTNFEQTEFQRGMGYIFGTPTAATPHFEGALHVGDQTWSGLTRDGVGAENVYDPGWHLVGNPYPAGIVFDSGLWSSTTVNITPQIWDDNLRSYTAVTAGSFIPPMTAFFVQVTQAPGSFSIDQGARAHGPGGNKSSTDYIILSAQPVEGNTQQLSYIRHAPDTKSGYDNRYHSRFRRGYAPEFFSLSDGQRLLVNAFSEIHEDLTIPFAFRKNEEGNNFKIGLVASIPGVSIFLADLKLGTEQELTMEQPYEFTAENGDDLLRFELRFKSIGDATNIEDPDARMARIYAYNKTLVLEFSDAAPSRVLEVYDLSGRILIQQTLENTSQFRKHLDLLPGVYVVRVSDQRGVQTERVFIH